MRAPFPAFRSSNKVLTLLLVGLAAPLAGCLDLAGKGGGAGETAMFRRLESANVKVDPATAAGMISALRAQAGLGPVTVNPALNAVAERQAKAMAAKDKLSHTVAGSLQSRVEGGGYNAGVATENIGGGYPTLAEAFSGWRASPGHKANMLNPGVTEIGIGTAFAPGSRYQIYWSLVLAAPFKG